MTERIKSDREIMTQKLIDMVVSIGGRAEIDAQWGHLFVKSKMVRISLLGGAELSVEFNGDTPKNHADIHVITWNVSTKRRGVRFSDKMGDINKWHRRKATRVCYGFEALLKQIKQDILLLNSGEGYQNDK